MIRNALFIFGICAAIFVFFLPSYLQMQELHGKNVAYDRQIRELSQENEGLSDERQRLEEDPTYLESVAREKFGIIRDDEVIYKIVSANTAEDHGQNAQEAVAVSTVSPATKARIIVTTGKPKPKSASSAKKTTSSAGLKKAEKKASASAKSKTTRGAQTIIKSE